MPSWTEVVLARAPFVVIFSANLLFPILVIDSVDVCVCVLVFFPSLASTLQQQQQMTLTLFGAVVVVLAAAAG